MTTKTACVHNCNSNGGYNDGENDRQQFKTATAMENTTMATNDSRVHRLQRQRSIQRWRQRQQRSQLTTTNDEERQRQRQQPSKQQR